MVNNFSNAFSVQIYLLIGIHCFTIRRHLASYRFLLTCHLHRRIGKLRNRIISNESNSFFIYRSDIVSDDCLRKSLYSRCFLAMSSELKSDMSNMLDGKMELETLGLGIHRRKGTSSRGPSLSSDKSSLSAYIRLFEPLVIKALKVFLC